MLNRLLREPLLHFLLLGALLFLVYELQNDDAGEAVLPGQIVISEAQLNALAARWQKKWQRPPTPTELNGLVEQTIREQVLYQEALSMGLDRDDPVVRRRMAQKIEFITSDLSAQAEPSEEQLEAYFRENADKFMRAGSVSFVQVYLNADRRGTDLERDAQALLDILEGDEPHAPIEQLGDPFMFGQDFSNHQDFEIARVFGQSFSDSLSTLPVGQWQGPLPSGLGVHLVRLDNRTAPEMPPLAEVREQVVAEWQETQRQAMDKALYQRMREKYEIVLPSTFDPS